jgi:putative phosphonate metabolism protein
MTGYRRYAIYAAPPPGTLADFAAAWLGWDAALGCSVDHPDLPGLPRPVAEITATPRRYGFHATLKPPFRLGTGYSRAALEQAVEALAKRLAPVTLDRLVIARLGGFLALVPQDTFPDVSRLAAKVVIALDPYRAHASAQELARHRGRGLRPDLEENLALWGYPYVMEAFRFHFTLTGRLARSEADIVKAALAPRLDPLLARPFPINALCLFAEDRNRQFHLLSRHPLCG